MIQVPRRKNVALDKPKVILDIVKILSDDGGMPNRIRTVLVDLRIQARVIHILDLLGGFFHITPQFDSIGPTSKKSIARV